MKIPSTILFRGIEKSAAVEAKIQQRIDEFSQFSPLVLHCEVSVDAPHGHHHKGRLYEVRIRVKTPGEDLEVGRQPAEEDVYVAIRNAFDAARRQLEDYQRRYRSEVKHHEEPPVARVARLFPAEGYGFLETPEGREIYFHRNSVRESSFSDLRVGTAVAFSEEAGLRGPQAAAVKIVARGELSLP